MPNYLEFEKTIKALDEDISNAKIKGDNYAVEILEKNLDKEVSKIYKNLNEYQRLQLARHPDRPYALDYIDALIEDKYEIHGDRAFGDDPAIVCFSGYIGDKKVIVIGEEKGRGTKNKLYRNFGMPQPEGYRKALRIARLAEKFQIPVIFLVDTPGAYPGIGAEERGQSEAIARNLFEFSNIKTFMISIVIGEGGSGGALALSVADKVAMLENSVFSVISPEGCAAILYNDPNKVESAAKSLKITASELKEQNLIDDVIKEPNMAAHRDKIGIYTEVGKYIIDKLNELENIGLEEALKERLDKILSIGAFKDAEVNK